VVSFGRIRPLAGPWDFWRLAARCSRLAARGSHARSSAPGCAGASPWSSGS